MVLNIKPGTFIKGSFGNRITIKSKFNGRDVWITYAHLNKVEVGNKQVVILGQRIGLTGNTGNAAAIYKNGKLIHGIEPQYYHVHITASFDGIPTSNAARNDPGNTTNPEQFFQTQFDSNGESIGGVLPNSPGTPFNLNNSGGFLNGGSILQEAINIGVPVINGTLNKVEKTEKQKKKEEGAKEVERKKKAGIA